MGSSIISILPRLSPASSAIQKENCCWYVVPKNPLKGHSTCREALSISAEDAAHREVKEETGLDIAGCRYLFSIPNLYPYSGFEVHTVDMFFECLTESFDGAKAEDDAAEIIILPANQLNPDDFGLQSIKKAVDRYIK